MINRILLFALILVGAVSSAGQSGIIKTDDVHFVSLEGNLVGDSPKRNVIVFLPPGYEEQKKLRYPVVYLLHGFNGFGVGNKGWIGEGGALMSKALAGLSPKGRSNR